jgi:rsbT antagonist protein RsbS
MNDPSELPRVTINLMRGCLVATIQLDLDRLVLERFRKDLLEKLDASRSRQVILDCSGIEVLDAEDFDALRRTIAMAALMGAWTVLAGLQPGVVSALIDLNVDPDRLHTVLSLDDAFRLLETRTENTEDHPAPDCGEEYADVAPQ